ncbi:hypothetical protein VKI21_06365 [Cyanobacterium aponinum UTEX 3222]|uniref:hypothetical protein n=1 Tax=Cyanobacterium aponinum TaxID=379064 RepID=UPI003092102A|nr:hypothetical protein VKI21_06365 [Cyanobacterium aponinum UTEX 3222]
MIYTDLAREINMVLFAPFNSPFKVNDNTITANAFSRPDVGIDSNGNFVVVWQEPFNNDINDFDIRGTVFDPSGAEIPFPESEIFISSDVGSEFNPSIAVAPDGFFVVAYSRNDDIFARRFNITSDGINQVGNEILVATFEQNKLQSFPQVAIDSEGDFSVVWTHQFEADDSDIRGRLFNADGSPITDDIPISSSFSNESESAIASVPIANNNNPNTDLVGVVSYTVDFGGSNTIFFRRFGNDGNQLGAEINAVSEANRDKNQTQSSIAIDSQGDFVIAWTHEFGENDTDIHFRRFNSDGTALDSTEIIVDSSLGNQNNPDVDLAPDGSILISYTDESSNSVKYRQFNTNGEPLGDSATFDVEGNQETNSAIAVGTNNKAVVVADAGNNNSFNPYGQILTPDASNTLNVPLNRFQNTNQPGTYLFAGEQESQNIRQNFPNFVEEGFAFSVAENPQDNLIRFNRFQNSDRPGTYLFAGEQESQNIRQNFPNFIEEGVAFYAFGAGSNQATPFYRFQNTDVPGTYLFVGDSERQSILQNFPNFVEEGIAFEAAT